VSEEEQKYPARHAYRNADVAEEYDSKRLRTKRDRLFHNMEIKAVIAAANEMPADSRVLELPAGTGRTLMPLSKHFREVVGVDISEEMLAMAKQKFADTDNVTLMHADGTALPFKDGEFDCAFSVRLFGHTPPEIRLAILKELARVTSDRVALMMYVRDPLITLRKKLQVIVHPPRGPWYPIASMKELHKLFESVGWKILSVKSLMPCILESRMVIARKA